jgi:chitinase
MKLKYFSTCYLIAFLLLALSSCQNKKPVQNNNSGQLAVIAYYAGDAQQIDQYNLGEITHVIYSFLHLKGDELAYDSPEDSLGVAHLIASKEKYPNLKVMVSLGGWGGCKTCSEVFSTPEGRKTFARSVKRILDNSGADGIDLDWEYPSIEGFPGHQFLPEDRDNFTALVTTLRHTLGRKAIISFAAGGFAQFLENSIDWKAVMPEVNYVNLMSYDLVNGFSKVTGHHTPLYSNAAQAESTDSAVRYMEKAGVPSNKIVIGAAFYARVWKGVKDVDNGLYQAGIFKQGVGYNRFDSILSPQQGFKAYWDSVAQAPYMYNAKDSLFATYDDPRSVALKTKYAYDHHLGGIMFWQLANDKKKDGLLDAIYKAKEAAEK